MLSRTADNLFWLGRYIERADFLARIMEAAIRLAAIPSHGSENEAWKSAIASSGVAHGFYAQYDKPDERNVRSFLGLDANNPSSLWSCLGQARNNARSVRTAITIELWEAINEAYNQLNRFEGALDHRDLFNSYLEWVKTVSLAVDGATLRTMLRSDAYWFLRLGGEIERADNTARLLDVKYHLLLPAGEKIGGGLDYFQWTTLLREVSALTAYRWVYRDSVKPWLVADLLILNRQMPRSLATCHGMIVGHLDRIATAYSRRGPSQRLAADILSKLQSARIEDIFQAGLHEFITSFLNENHRLGQAITDQYLT